MGQLGISELIFIFVIALLVFGPKKLPGLGKSLGQGLKEFKRATDDLKHSWDEQVKDVEKSVEDAKTSVTRDMPKDDFYAEYDSPAAEPETPVATVQPDPEADKDRVADKQSEESKDSKDEVHQA